MLTLPPMTDINNPSDDRPYMSVASDYVTSRHISLHELKAHCSACSLREICLPFGLDRDDIIQLDAVISSRRRVRRSEPVYRVGEPFEAIYAIRLGSFKSVILAEDGREQVSGYHMPGDLIGMDGIGAERHACEAVALEDSEVCVLPFHRLEELARSMAALQHNLHLLMSREIARDHQMMLVLGSMRAEERLAAFLLNLSRRYHRRGYSSTEFVLRMTREEIGSYLGLKLETVSRLFSKFQEEGLIKVQQKAIKLIDIPALKTLIGQHC